MDKAAIQKKVFNEFKARGLSLQMTARDALVSVLLKEQEYKDALDMVLVEIKERIEKREIKSTVIDLAIIESIVFDLSSTEEDMNQESTQLMDAFNSPKLEFDEKQKTYKIITKPKYSLHGNVSSRASMYRERLLLTQQRLIRSGNFTMKGMESYSGTASSTDNQSGKFELSTIASLLGSKKKVKRALLGNFLYCSYSQVLYLNLSRSPLTLQSLHTRIYHPAQ